MYTSYSTLQRKQLSKQVYTDTQSLSLIHISPALMAQMPLKKKVANPALRRRVFCCSMVYLSLRKYPFSI